MKSKIKVVKSILSLSFVFFVLGYVFFCFFELNHTTANASYYVSKGVAAKISGNYYVGDLSYTMKSNESDSVIFNKGDETSQKSLSPTEQISLSTEDGSVIFRYAFENLDDETAFAVELYNLPEIENMNVYYDYSFDELEDFSQICNSDYTLIPVLKGNGKTSYLYIKVQIDNLANNASFVGSFGFQLFSCEISKITLIDKDKTNTIYAVYGNEIESVEFNAVDNEQFMGYFTQENGQGTQIVDSDGDFISICDFSEDMTLYAYYKVV